GGFGSCPASLRPITFMRIGRSSPMDGRGSPPQRKYACATSRGRPNYDWNRRNIEASRWLIPERHPRAPVHTGETLERLVWGDAVRYRIRLTLEFGWSTKARRRSGSPVREEANVREFSVDADHPPPVRAERGRRGCRRGDGERADGGQRAGADQHAVAEHVAVEGHIPRIC